MEALAQQTDASTDEAYGIESENRLFLRETGVDEAMGGMIFSALRNSAPLLFASNDHQHRIENRQGHQQERNREGRERRRLRAIAAACS